jgi:hypothetical protein
VNTAMAPAGGSVNVPTINSTPRSENLLKSFAVCGEVLLREWTGVLSEFVEKQVLHEVTSLFG